MTNLLKTFFGRTACAPATPAPAAVAATQQRFEEAVRLHQQGRLQEAKALYTALLAEDSKRADVLHMLGLIAAEMGELSQAADLISQAAALQPASAGIHVSLANVLQDLQQFDAADASYARALALAPGDVQSWFNRGMAQRAAGRLDAAIESYDTVIRLQPGLVQAWFNRGNAHLEQGQLEAAVRDYAQATTLAPDYAHAWFNRAHAQQALGQRTEALASYDSAIRCNPGYAEAYGNRGTLLQQLGRLEDSVASFDEAARLQPGNAEIHYNRGNSLRDLLRLDAAIASYGEALRLKPDHAGAGLNLGMALLLHGDWARGWPLYEWRWQKHGIAPDRRDFTQPRWNGRAPLAGKTVLLYAEQGLGDTLQFSRYARQVKALGARVVVEVQAPLIGLLTGLEGVDALVRRGDPLPAFDVHCPLLSLPMAVGTTVETMPPGVAYLKASSAKIAHWGERLGPQARPRAGLVWSGSTEHANDLNRSLRLKELSAHLPQGLEYVCLQKEVRDADKPALGSSEIRFVGGEIHDLSDTAALCELVDVVISVDTCVAHLAGALGRPVWVLLPHVPDWRWLLGRADSPWYASARLYRQNTARHWAPVLGRVAADLAAIGRPS